VIHPGRIADVVATKIRSGKYKFKIEVVDL